MNTRVGLYTLVCMMVLLVNVEAPPPCHCVTGNPQSDPVCPVPAGFVCPPNVCCTGNPNCVALLYPYPGNVYRFLSCAPYCTGSAPAAICLTCPSGLKFCQSSQRCEFSTFVCPP